MAIESSFTLMEAPANLASCLMCAPFFPMMAPTACVGMKRFTVSCSGYWKGNTRRDVIPTEMAPSGTQQLPSIYHKPSAVKAPMPKEVAKMVPGALCGLRLCGREAYGMNLTAVHLSDSQNEKSS